MKIIDYVIVRSEEAQYLAEYVRERILKGWQPYGPVFMNGCCFNQPMVQYETPAKETLFEGVPISKLDSAQRERYADSIVGGGNF